MKTITAKCVTLSLKESCTLDNPHSILEACVLIGEIAPGVVRKRYHVCPESTGIKRISSSTHKNKVKRLKYAKRDITRKPMKYKCIKN